MAEATDAAAFAGDDGTARHRRPHPAKGPSGAWIRRGNRGGKSQGGQEDTGEIDDASLTKTTPLPSVPFSESLKPMNSALNLLDEKI